MEQGLENLTLIGRIEGKKDRGKQRVTCLTSLCKWMEEQEVGGTVKRQIVRSTTKDRKLWRTMSVNVLKGYCT